MSRGAFPALRTMTVAMSRYSVYTIKDGRELARLARRRRVPPFHAGRRWVTASKLWHKAREAREGMPVLFGDATDVSQLRYWGWLTEIAVGDRETSFKVDRLRKFKGKHAPQELTLRSSRREIRPGFIRPYAICLTPRFL